MAAAAAALAVAACGGGASGGGARPVATQVREVLRGALHSDAAGTPAGTLLPYRDVAACRGPRAGGPGVYTCATSPRGAQGVTSLAVEVTPAGVWSVELPFLTTASGRKVAMVQGLWGPGIRLPR
jgi:hypothetical protein